MDFWDEIQPKIRQWEITHGRTMPKQQYQALVEGELSVATKSASDMNIRGRALNLQEDELALRKEQAEKADKAAAIKGVADIGTTVGTGYLAYKGLGIAEKNAASMEKLTERLVGGGKAPALDFGKSATGFGGAAAPAIDLAEISPGVFAAPSAEAAGFGLGGQAALTKTAPMLATNTSFATEAAATEAIASGAPSAAAAGPGLGTIGLAGAAGYAGGYIASKLLGANEDITQALELGGAGIGIGFALAGPPGALIGGLIGGAASLFDDSVVCSELLRQGRITPRDRTKCVVFRFRHIPDEMFDAYLEWAAPHVREMRNGGWRNAIRLPFAHAFVGYMIAIQERRYPSFFERTVWNFAWRRCEKIARKNEAVMAEVA
ncbi:MAG: hypothetical protein WA058_02060 [Minisyncoccia bacterium]